MHVPVASHPNFGTGTSEQPDPQGLATLVLAGKASSARRALLPWVSLSLEGWGDAEEQRGRGE